MSAPLPATGPGQVAMDDMSKGGGSMQPMQKEQPVLMSRSARASPVATAGYLTITAGHLCLLRMHSQASSSDGYFFLALALVELTLAFEAFVFAVGGGLQRTLGLNLLSLAGRARMLTAAMAWPWLVPWVSELGCRCGTVSLQTGAAWLHLTFGLAVFTSGFYLVREVAFMVRGEPPSALGGAPPQFGDCLPTNALLGGQFRMEKADLEVTGRAVFVPARPRQGLYIGAGLAMLSHLVMGLLHLEMPPWLLLGARPDPGIPLVAVHRTETPESRFLGNPIRSGEIHPL